MNPAPLVRVRRWFDLRGAAVLATVILLLPSAAEAMHPNHPLGSDPERPAQGSAEGIDQVDLFSGAMSLGIPIGPFSLNYSSSVWHYEENASEITARPEYERTGGIGWHLGWGELYDPGYFFNETDQWLYVDRNGSRHSFYRTLHHDDGATADGDMDNHVFYTRDGSYLRMTLSDEGFECSARIEEPDGTTRLFADYGGACGPSTPRRLLKVWSPFASEADPDLSITYGVDPADPTGTEDTLRTVTHRHGLTHKVYLSDKMNGDPADPVHWVRRIVTRVEIEVTGGQTAIYDFTYRQFNLAVSCKTNAGETPIAVPHLERVDLPDGTSYSMEEGGQLLYENQCRSIGGFQVDDLPGALTGINLPTGGKIRWTYQRYEFPPGDTSSVFNTSAAVKTRTLHSAGATATPSNAIGTWTYKATTVDRTGTWPNLTHPERHVEVVFPTGHCTKHFFDAIYWVQPSKTEGWERGLPFIYSAPDTTGTRYLSSEIWSSSDSSDSCDGDKLRSTYLRFRHDPPPGQAPSSTNGVALADFYNTNRQVEASRVVYHDDSERYRDVASSDFDGLGNFRATVVTGDFYGSERTETYLGFNRSAGTYPASYTEVMISEPWILGVFDAVETTEPGALGVTTVRTEYGFEDATGFLCWTRQLASGATRSDDDVLTFLEHYPSGRVSHVRTYGGDLQTLPATVSCGQVPTQQPAYWETYGYTKDILLNIRPRTPTGGWAPFLTYNIQADLRTGVLLSQRDPAGFEEVYAYDGIGRLKSVTPQSGASVHYTYTNPTATSQAKVTTTFKAANGSATLAQQEVVLDDFGRLRLERQRLPGGVWSERETLYNARGWVTSTSEWGDLSKKTTNVSLDALGRPLTVRPPDGATHDIAFRYHGDRRVKTTAKIALAGGEAWTRRIFYSDTRGRLRAVRERSDPTAAWGLTNYSYDSAGLLTRVQAGQQIRSFEYDGRGFLLSETHPEKGVNGNGTVTYGDYDAGGLPHFMVDGPNDLSFTYDFMGRPLRTYDRGKGSRLVRRFAWDAPGILGLGKLYLAIRYNYLDLPWNATGEELVQVRDKFSYNAVGGAVASKTTRIKWSSEDARFVQLFSYDDLGSPSKITYPYCNLPGACSSGDPSLRRRTVSYSYDQGVLTGVTGTTLDQGTWSIPYSWITGMTYHPSGLWRELAHANGITDRQDQDPSFTGRPSRLHSTGGSSTFFDSGIMSYDGSGNIKQMGDDTFTYDKVSRLVDASYDGGTFGQNYAYDRHGNLTNVGGFTFGMVTPPVDPSTNRLIGGGYDGAGNLLHINPPLPWQFTYDTDNRLTSQANMRYLYDAFGERTISLANISNEAALFHLRDPGNRVLSEIRMTDGVWGKDHDFIYAGDRLVAQAESGQSTGRHFHLDHLGSTRLITEANGAYLSQHLFFPYGEDATGAFSWDYPLFTGHERDGSTQTDYMHARHYWWKLGRFLSADPILGDPALPQSWNRYAYVLGNPINFTDPRGLDEENADGSVDNASTGDEGLMEEITVTGEFLGKIDRARTPAWAFSSFRTWSSNLGRLPTRNHLEQVDPVFFDEIDVVEDAPPWTVEDLIHPIPIDPNAVISPHLHAQGEFCWTYTRALVSDATDAMSIFGWAVANNQVDGGASIAGTPILLRDGRAATQASLLSTMMRFVMRRTPAAVLGNKRPGMPRDIPPQARSDRATIKASDNPRHTSGFYNPLGGAPVSAARVNALCGR